MSLSKLHYYWKFYLHLLNTVPIQTKSLTSALIAYTGNIITQKIFEKRPQMDQKRALKFVLFSLILTPISHYWYKYLDRIFDQRKKESSKKEELLESQKTTNFSVVFKKFVLDELLYDPFCILFFMTIISLLEGKDFSHIWQKIRTDYWITQKMSWRIWPLVQLVNFSLVPGNLRIFFINLVSFFWGIFLQVRAASL